MKQESQRSQKEIKSKTGKNHILEFITIGVFVLSLLLFGYGVFSYANASIHTFSQITGKELPIYCVEKDKKQIAISFDAAWGNEDTEKILSTLKKCKVKATFFMTGGWVEKYPEDVKKIAKAGHDLGNHSENHKQMSTLSKEQCKDEIMKVHEKVKTLTGKEMILFRPPYGDYNDVLIQTVEECGYYCIQWNVDSLDWKNYGAQDIITRVSTHKNLSNGSIILCHNGAKHTAEALEEMILTLQKQGYEFVPISKLIMKNKYSINHEGRQIKN